MSQRVLVHYRHLHLWMPFVTGFCVKVKFDHFSIEFEVIKQDYI